jgi:hypothetical protein
MSDRDKEEGRAAKEVAAQLSENVDLAKKIVDAIPDEEIERRVADATELGIALRDAEEAASDE